MNEFGTCGTCGNPLPETKDGEQFCSRRCKDIDNRVNSINKEKEKAKGK